MFRRTLQITGPLLVVLCAVGLRGVSVTSEYIERFANMAFDAYQRIAPRPYTDLPVRIVDIDDRSLADFGQWPWPRTLIARLVESLSEAGAASIAFDFVLSEPDRSSPRLLLETLRKTDDLFAAALPPLVSLADNDDLLATTLTRQPNVVLGDILTTGVVPKYAFGTRASVNAAGDNPFVAVKTFTGAIANLDPLEQSATGRGFLN
jgi:adenylate cyclase